MSCFVCSPLHIASVANWARENLDLEYPHAALYALVEENVQSVAWWSRNSTLDAAMRDMGAAPFRSDDRPFLSFLDACMKQEPLKLQANEAYSLAKSLDYQSCDSETYDSSYACVVLDSVMDKADTMRDDKDGPWVV